MNQVPSRVDTVLVKMLDQPSQNSSDTKMIIRIDKKLEESKEETA